MRPATLLQCVFNKLTHGTPFHVEVRDEGNHFRLTFVDHFNQTAFEKRWGNVSKGFSNNPRFVVSVAFTELLFFMSGEEYDGDIRRVVQYWD